MVNIGPARDLAAHVLEVAHDSRAHLPAYEVAVNHLKSAEEEVGSSGDISGIYGAVRLESGLRYSNQEE